MNVTTDKKKSWKPWVARIAFGASILALLGTSQPRWYMQATISGPNDGGAPPSGNKGLLVNVEASRGPSIAYNNRFGARIDPPWGRGGSYNDKDEPTKTSFLLPPGASIHSLTISGHCSGGCCSNEKCTPPSGSYIRATVDHVNVWTKSSRREQRITVSSGPKKEGEKTPRIPHVVVEVEAGRQVEIFITNGDNDGKAKSTQLANCYDPNAGRATTPPTDAAGSFDAASSSPSSSEEPPRHKCSHYPWNKPIKDPIEASFIVEATIWGACPAANTPCEAPADTPDPRILDLRSTVEY